MKTFHEDKIKTAIRDIPDFPQKGIIFKDITPILKDPQMFKLTIDALEDFLRERNIKYLAGIESRGFIFSPVLAYQMNVGFIPVRKKGKLPYLTEQMAYTLEYGEAIIEIHKDAIEPGARVAIVDDLLATGGTAFAAAKLIEKLGGKVAGIAFVIELLALKGREKLAPYEVFSLVQY